MITFVAIGIILLFIGNWIVKNIPFLWKNAIPGPVIGGFIFSIIALILYLLNIAQFEYDNSLYDLAMYVFFVTIGLTTGLSTLRKGGKILLIYMMVCWVLVFLQNGTSLGISYLMGMDPLLGLMAGQASLQGGHGMAGSLAPLIESLGQSSALTVGMTAATFGLIAGSVLGGPVGNYLITKNKLKIQTDDATDLESLEEDQETKSVVDVHSFLVSIGLIIVTLAIGLPTAELITEVTGFSVPGHIFSLFIGIVIRSICDHKKIIEISQDSMDIISSISLNLFLVMAMMKLSLWELANLAIPLTVLLIIQVVITIALAIFVMYRVIGKDYDAAVMTSGFIGHGLGATPNGLVVMNAVTNKYGVFSKKAFIIIPVAGTVLTDVVGVPVFVFLANLIG